MSRGRYYGRRKLTAADKPGLARDIQHARNRGDSATVKRLNKRAAQLQMTLYGGGTPEQIKAERPFDDEIPF
jgi:hypothetical protein